MLRRLRLLCLESFEDSIHLLLAKFAFALLHLLYSFGDFVPFFLTLLNQINLFVLFNYQLFKFLILGLGLLLDNLRQLFHFTSVLIRHLSNLLLHFLRNFWFYRALNKFCTLVRLNWRVKLVRLLEGVIFLGRHGHLLDFVVIIFSW